MSGTISCCQQEHIFDYTWQQIVKAFWKRYPNPLSTHVLTEDTIKREVRDGKLFTRRILTKTNPIPKWGKRFCKSVSVKILEDSILDPKSKVLRTYTRNIGMRKIMKIDEIVEYMEHTDGRTLAIRRAYITSQVFGFSRAIRAFGVERFKTNCTKTNEGFNYILKKMFPLTHLPPAHRAMKPLEMDPLDGSCTTTAEQFISNSSAALVTTSKNLLVNEQYSLNTSGVIKKNRKTSFDYIKGLLMRLCQLFSLKS